MRLAGGAAVLPFLPHFARAETYPNRPVRILVGFAAGGNFDVIARLIGQWVSEQLGQPVIVENRPGASSNLATEAVIRAPADGYTLLLGGAVNTVNATLYEKLSFNFVADVAPVAGLVRFPNVMTVGTSFPAKTVPRIHRLREGKSGQDQSRLVRQWHHSASRRRAVQNENGCQIHPCSLSRRLAGADRSAQRAGAGSVRTLPASIPHIKSGALRALAVTTATRSDALPDVPTVGEFVSGYEASGWSGLCAPRNTPAEIIETLNRVINAGLADAKLKTRLADLGATTLAGSSAEFGNLIAARPKSGRSVIRAANIKVGTARPTRHSTSPG